DRHKKKIQHLVRVGSGNRVTMYGVPEPLGPVSPCKESGSLKHRQHMHRKNIHANDDEHDKPSPAYPSDVSSPYDYLADHNQCERGKAYRHQEILPPDAVAYLDRGLPPG